MQSVARDRKQDACAPSERISSVLIGIGQLPPAGSMHRETRLERPPRLFTFIRNRSGP